MSFSFLHTADWQIGKRFSNLVGDAGALVRRQRLKTVEAVAELATRVQADAVLVAGDVFESNAVSDETLRRTMLALTAFRGPWVLLPGNHDAALAQSAWSRMRSLGIVPDSVILALTPHPIVLDDGGVILLPAPLMRRHETVDLTDYYDQKPTDAGLFRVGLAHGSVTDHLPEGGGGLNPIASDRAVTARLDYLALGDWHGTRAIDKRTWYAGTPEPDRFKENDAGNVLRVVLEAPGADPLVEKVAVGYFRWHTLSVEVGDGTSVAWLERRLAALEVPQRWVVRLRMTGACDMDTRQRVDALVAAWRARLHHLEVDDRGLVALPSQADMMAMGAHGFVQDAITTLQSIQADPHHVDQAAATEALRILYHERMAQQAQEREGRGVHHAQAEK